MSDIPSTIKEPRFYATCRHCDNSFGSFTMSDLYNHLQEHEIGIHFSDVKVISNVIEKFEFMCTRCDEGFHTEKELQIHEEDNHCECEI